MTPLFTVTRDGSTLYRVKCGEFSVDTSLDEKAMEYKADVLNQAVAEYVAQAVREAKEGK